MLQGGCIEIAAGCYYNSDVDGLCYGMCNCGDCCVLYVIASFQAFSPFHGKSMAAKALACSVVLPLFHMVGSFLLIENAVR